MGLGGATYAERPLGFLGPIIQSLSPRHSALHLPSESPGTQALSFADRHASSVRGHGWRMSQVSTGNLPKGDSPCMGRFTERCVGWEQVGEGCVWGASPGIGGGFKGA